MKVQDLSPENVWLITDTHFDHKNIIQYCNRPEDFSQQIIDNWNKLVKPDDIVLHLGDVAWPKFYQEHSFKELPGKKILIRGNHDEGSIFYFMNHGFDFACDAVDLKVDGLKLRFTHEPCVTAHFDVNVHGHLHLLELSDAETVGCYYDISMEKMGFYGPLQLSRMLPLFKKAYNKWRQDFVSHPSFTEFW